MSKYEPLWSYVGEQEVNFILSFEEIEEILGFPIDHSFLSFKKELIAYGWQVEKISMKNKNVSFKKLSE